MTELEDRSAGFQAKYDGFVHSCDAAEADGRWDRAEYGEMEGYCFSALMGILLSLINADGNIGSRETEFLNRNFGFSYTVDDLIELYGYCGRDIEANSGENAREVMALLRETGGGLAEEFRDLVLLICDIIAESDDGVNEQEADMLRHLRETVLN